MQFFFFEIHTLYKVQMEMALGDYFHDVIFKITMKIMSEQGSIILFSEANHVYICTVYTVILYLSYCIAKGHQLISATNAYPIFKHSSDH